MLRQLLAPLLRRIALRSGRLSGLYRRIGQPDGQAWAEFIRRHGQLHAMGQDCVIQSNVTITDPRYVRLGNNVHLSGCTLFGHDGAVNMLNKVFSCNLDKVGKIDIRDNVFIGHQAIIMPGVTIGPMAIVAANAVVTSDVPVGSIVGGSPARVIGQVAALLERLERETAALPWRDALEKRQNRTAPADAALDALRIAHFFAQPANKENAHA